MTTIGDYEARALDASGGVVRYAATHVVLPRRAIIELVADAAPRCAAVRLLRHACILEALRDAAVPRVFECGRLDGQPWVALEAPEGVLLETDLESRALDVAELLDILEQVGVTLCHAHARGVLHRDVSPAAIVREPTRNRILLSGWGNACTLDAELVPAPRSATRFHPPEPKPGRAADIYALGMTGLQALAGPDPTLSTQPRVPKTLTVLLAAMVSDDPVKRPSAAEVVAAVRALRATQPKAGYDASLEVEIEYDTEIVDEPVLLEQPRLKPRWTPQHPVDVSAIAGVIAETRTSKR